MEGNLSSRNMMQGNNPYGGFDLHGPLRVNHHHQPLGPNLQQGSSIINAPIPENFPLTIGNNQDCDHTISVIDYGKLDRVKPLSDEDEPSFTEDIPDGRNNDMGKGKKALASSPWQRVKWTDTMVRLLITAVSYISEETAAENAAGVRRKCANLQKKGKWKSVSKVMAERGHFVSPQQCEDKFNDLNKRYKRLNEILGRGTSCEIVENPALLDMMDHVTEKAKEEVRKILSSKHLHYEEMCSYHNKNRLHLPPDPDLQHSLRLALRSREDHDDNNLKTQENDFEADNQEGEYDDHGESEENYMHGFPGNSAKRARQSPILSSLDCNKNAESDPSQAPSEGRKTNTALQKQWIKHRNHQLEERKFYIEAQMLELEKEKLKWQRISRKKDREMEAMRMENERMKLENSHMALEIREKEMEMGILDD